MKKVSFFNPLLLKALVFTIGIIEVWYFFLWDIIREYPENIEISVGVAQLFLAFSVFLPSLVLYRMVQEYDQLEKAIRKEDLETFKEVYFKRMPYNVYFIMVLFAIFAIIIVMVIPYERAYTGLLCVGGLTLFHVYLYFSARDLDNPDISKMNLPRKWIKEIEKIKLK